MRLVVVCTALLALAPVARGDDPYASHVAKTPPRSPEEERKLFRLPPGFEIQLVASEPDIAKPLNLAFDAHGRLWVTNTVEYPYPAPPDRKPRDGVRVLEDFGPDGRARKVSTFADGLNIPIGLMPTRDGLIVHSIPNIYRLRDTDGDGKADTREVLYSSVGYRDTHGMTSAFTWGFDGWLYACHGYANESQIKARDGSAVRLQSGNTYRMRPDGSHIEQVTHGQVNPFGLCFDPLGNLYSADCHTRPVMMLLRGGWYESFGKPHDGLGFAPEMCTHDHGSTAIAGIVYYAADQFPPPYRDTLYVGNVVTNRINHDRLQRHGSTYKAIEQPDFLVSADPWFRPVDIKLGPDGALYVADFYNRIIGHYEVPLDHPGRDRDRGRIWRIVYRGPDGNGPPRAPRADWAKATTAELIDDLAHPNLSVRTLATNQLVERGGLEVLEAVRAVLRPACSPFQRVHGLWVLHRLNALDEATLLAAGRDIDAAVRVHAMRVLTERPGLSPALEQMAAMGLRDPDGFVQRAAAEALGAHPSPDHLAPLLALRHVVPAEDTHLLYVVRMALRDQLRPAANWSSPVLASLKEADARAVADVALGVPSAEAAAFLLAHVQGVPQQTGFLTRAVHHVARYGQPAAMPELLRFARGQRPDDLRSQAALFRAVQQGTQERGGKLSDAARQWGTELTGRLVGSTNDGLAVTGIELAGSLPVPAEQDRLVERAARRDASEKQRRAAISALAAIDGKRHAALFSRLLADGAEAPAVREHAAQTLGNLNLPEARAELVRVMALAPARLELVLALGLAGSPEGAEELLTAVAAGKASARLLQERWVQLRLQATKGPHLEERLAKLTQGLPPADRRLQELLQRRREGYVKARPDAALGAQVFEKNCGICHQLANRGAKIGPQLDGIGVRGLDRLLEDILDPNKNVDQAFRSTTLVLKNGQMVSGLVLREEGEVVIVADAQGKEVRVPRNTIEDRAVSNLSPMPANLAEQMPEADFYHLLAYLLAQRPPKEAKSTP
jgi:putative heme-binding domain-containing protein